jgi:hypothetical protein
MEDRKIGQKGPYLIVGRTLQMKQQSRNKDLSAYKMGLLAGMFRSTSKQLRASIFLVIHFTLSFPWATRLFAVPLGSCVNGPLLLVSIT